MSDDRNVTCTFCGARTVETESVRLWDGRSYCTDCVEEVCPGLVAFARSHDVLEEIEPACFLRRILYMTYVGVLCFPLMFILFGGFSLILRTAEPVTELCTLAGWFAVAAWGIALLSQVFYVVCARSTVSVRDGAVAVSARWSPRTFRAALDKCSWDLNGLGTGGLGGKELGISEPVLTLTLPPYVFLGMRWAHVTPQAGFTPQTCQMWLGLLILAGVPRVHQRLGWRKRPWDSPDWRPDGFSYEIPAPEDLPRRSSHRAAADVTDGGTP